MQQYSSARSGEYFQIELYGNQESHILKDDSDFNYFLNLLNKYLLDNETVDLLAYCLNGGSIHMLLYQFSDGKIDLLLKNICLDYDKYFFNKYGIKNVLDLGSRVITKTDTCLIMRASKNIHLLPNEWLDYPYSSIRSYLYDDTPDWLSKDHIVDLCGTTENYFNFISRAVAK